MHRERRGAIMRRPKRKTERQERAVSEGENERE